MVMTNYGLLRKTESECKILLLICKKMKELNGCNPYNGVHVVLKKTEIVVANMAYDMHEPLSNKFQAHTNILVSVQYFSVIKVLHQCNILV